MAPKKRDRDEVNTRAVSQDAFRQDHELFLQAFEKPTQIYRYLRTRGLLSPLFLQRNLTYMKRLRSSGRLKRSAPEHIGVDQLLARVVKSQIESTSIPGEYLTISHLGLFYTPTGKGASLPAVVSVDTTLNKLTQRRRKESVSPVVTTEFGGFDVCVNPDETTASPTVPVTCIPSDRLIGQDGGGCSKWLTLCLRVSLQESSNGENEEPAVKRRRLSRCSTGPSTAPSVSDLSNQTLTAQLPLTDRAGRWLLTDGEYDVLLNKQSSNSSTSSSASPASVSLPSSASAVSGSSLATSPRRTSWERFKDRRASVSFDSISRTPTLKLRIAWSDKPSKASVERPRPLQPICANQLPSSGSHAHGDSTLTNGIASRHRRSRLSAEDGSDVTANGTVLSSSRPDLDAGDERDAKRLRVKGRRSSMGAAAEAASSPVSERSGEMTPSLVVYRFVYGPSGALSAETRQQTEARRDLVCPWCCLNCRHLYALLKHLQLCHARFTFKYKPIADGASIEVTVNESYDSSYAGNPHDLARAPLNGATAGHVRGPSRRGPSTALLVCRPRRNRATLAEFVQSDGEDRTRPLVSGHNRMYHRTSTNLPISPSQLDYDSEGEHDHPWLRVKTERMLNEFSDVNDGEKRLMLLWNLHVLRHNFVGDCQVPAAITMFIDQHFECLVDSGLYRNLILHLCSLHDFGIISPGHVYRSIQQFHQLVEKSPALTAKLAQHITTTSK